MPAPKPDATPRQRPSRDERHDATLRVLIDYGDALRAAARRFALSPEDAEDALARGVEIALEKAPATDPDELVPWLRTVIKHEAFALRRKTKRARPSSDEPEVFEAAHAAPDVGEEAAIRERLAVTVAALAELKPQEARAIRLKARGYSYNEICAETGWTYTKVNRCLTEGRASLRRRIAGAER